MERAQAEMTVLEGEAMKALTGESKMDINIIAIPYDPMIRVSQGKTYILPLQIDGIQGIIEMGKDRVDDVAKKDKLSKGAYTCIISVVTDMKYKDSVNVRQINS